MNNSASVKNPYRLNKCRQLLRWACSWYNKNKEKLNASERDTVEEDLEKLQDAVLADDRLTAHTHASKLEAFINQRHKKSYSMIALEALFALLLAFVIATLVRQMWFELYEIPTGSMRPTFYEQDHLTVTKTAFGINTPLSTSHLLFEPSLVQRSSVFIFSTDGIPMSDSDSTYFGIIPYKKRLIKRDMGHPSDTLYFYGGKVWGVDAAGKEIRDFIDGPWMEKLEYIPFLNFQGEITVSRPNEFVFHLFNRPTGRLTLSPFGKDHGEVFNGKEWVDDKAAAGQKKHDTVQTYADLFGIKNFAMARLLTKKQLTDNVEGDWRDIEEGALYLELKHNPSLSYPHPAFNSEYGRLSLRLNPYTTVIPLEQRHLDALMDNMYTARFVVKGGRATRYSVNQPEPGSYSPIFDGVEDGTYEFYYGKAYKIGWTGIRSEVDSDFPLYSRAPENVQKLFNLGIDMEEPPVFGMLWPRRYAYFRFGDLYSLGGKVIGKEDPILATFNKREERREKRSTAQRPYVAFKDWGPPLKENGDIDIDFLKVFGLKIPAGHYLALGDNHAMSGDSRVFGPVPETNLQGAPSVILWPPHQWGLPAQKPYPLFNLPRTIVWSVAALVLLAWWLIHRWLLRRRVFFKANRAQRTQET